MTVPFPRSILFLCPILSLPLAVTPGYAQQSKSIARQWNEQLLAAIRFDEARPTVHARNLFHTAIVMWDAWAAYSPGTTQMLHQEHASADDIAEARHQAISYAAYRLLQWRFKQSPNYPQTNTALRQKMADLGYDVAYESTDGDGPAALGNRIAKTVIEYGLQDGANELANYRNRFYRTVNPGLDPHKPGNPLIKDPDRWQPFDLPNFVGQSGLRSDGYPEFVGPEWGSVTPFSLRVEQAFERQRDGVSYRLYFDPGEPPRLSGDAASRARFKAGYQQVVEWSGDLDPADGKLIDISPGSRGDNTLGANDGDGHDINPATGKPYAPLLVRAGDYYRVLAEFWADGPSSETPPGHWFTLLNVVSDQPALVKKFAGQGPLLDDLEWDVRSYLTLGGAMHDAAIAAWGVKGWYDSPRPISAIRYMCQKGQDSDPNAARYHSDGISLLPGSIEQLTSDTVAAGERHAHLAGPGNVNLGKIAIHAWRGPDFVEDPKIDVAGVDWILCENWWPYQRPNFVSPPFAGYMSGHSTYSRAAAEVLTLLTGSKYFPGGMGIFNMPRDTYLVFEKGPSQAIQLQWATYQDAADECGLSRIYGGIHPPFDDIPGRRIGYEIGIQAFELARDIFNGKPWRQ